MPAARPRSRLMKAMMDHRAGGGAPEASPGKGSENGTPKKPKLRALAPEEKAALTKLTNFLTENPDKILKVWAKVEHDTSEAAAPKKDDDDEGPFWHSTYQYFRKIPKYWYAAFLVREGIFSKEDIDRIDAKDKVGLVAWILHNTIPRHTSEARQETSSASAVGLRSGFAYCRVGG